MDDLVGQMVGGYRIEALLGSGGMGRVFRARQTQLDRVVAFKVLHQQYAGDVTFQARFRQEARAAAALNHPNIIEIHDFGESDGWYYLVMEMVADGSLRSLLREEPNDDQPPLWARFDLVRQAADGLAYAHSLKMVHRDIKPDNLLLRRLPFVAGDENEYAVKISDFGLAKLAEGGVHTLSGQTMGTPAYMSPEQCKSGNLDGRSDLYSLGVVLYEIATGHVPFAPKSLSDAIYNHVYVEPPSPREAQPNLPDDLEAIILRCLRKDPAERFATGAELSSALRDVVLQLRTGTPRPFTIQQSTRYAPTTTGPVHLTLDPEPVTLVPGEFAHVRVRVGNRDSRPRRIELAVEGVPQNWVVSPIGVIEVDPWAEQTVVLPILVPQASDHEAGSYHPTIRVHRHDDPDVAAEAATTWVIAPIREAGLQVTSPPSTRWGGGTAMVSLQNLGNVNTRIDLRARPSQPGVGLAVEPSTVELDPGKSSNIAVRIDPPVRWGWGSLRLLITIEALIDGNAAKTAVAELVQRSLMPVWVLSLVLVLLVGMGGIAYAFNGRSGSGGNLTPTSLPLVAAGSATQTTVSAAMIASPSTTAASTATPPPTSTSAAAPVVTTPGPQLPRLLFTTGRGSPPGILEIYAVNADGSNLTRLTQNNQDDWEPAVSADGKRVAFVSTRDGHNQIYVMNVDGSDQQRLTDSSGSDEYPNWSSDGSRLTFSRKVAEKTSLYVVNSDGSHLLELAPSGDGSSWAQAWSPDGRQIVFVSDRFGQPNLFVVNVDGSNLRRLTSSTGDLAPQWSHDGQHIVFTSNRDGNFEIYVMNADGSGQRRLTSTPENDLDPVWSPDDQQIGFVAGNEIATMRVDGSLQRTLTQNANYDSWLRWSPDGGYLAFAGKVGDDRELFVVKADGSGMQRLTDNPTFDGNEAWLPVAASSVPIPTPTSASQAGVPTPTPRPSAPTPTPRPPGPTPTRAPTPSPTPTAASLPVCANEPVRGFGLLWTSNPGVANGVGCPTGNEVGLVSRVQTYDHGVMLWLDTTSPGVDQENWVLTLVDGTVSRYRVPSDVPAWDDTATAPTGAFQWVWENVYTDQQLLGNATAPDYMTDAALQFFDSGTMIWLKAPPDGGKPEIYVERASLTTASSASYQVYPDLSY